MNVRKRLEKAADKKYQKFSASLIPNINNVLGVRLPVLRKLAKELYISGNYKYLFESSVIYMEENMLKGMIIGLLEMPVSEVFIWVRDFIPEIDNWSVCDSFCCALKITNKNLEYVWAFLQPYFKSQREFELRFSYVMLLNYFLVDEYIDNVFILIDEFRDDRYYSQMAVAWLVSACYVKYPKKTEKYLKKSKLNIWTFNKGIQKICESLKVDEQAKKRLRLMKK